MGKTQLTPEALLQRVRDLEEQVSKLQATEGDLRESEEQYRLLVESSTEMILFCDTDWKIRYATMRLLALSGYTREEVLGQSIGRFLERKAFERMKTRLESAATTDGPRELCETAFIHREGHAISIEVISSLIVDQAGPKGFLFNVRDISERKAIETELQKANKLESIGVLAGGLHMTSTTCLRP